MPSDKILTSSFNLIILDVILDSHKKFIRIFKEFDKIFSKKFAKLIKILHQIFSQDLKISYQFSFIFILSNYFFQDLVKIC